MQVDEGLSLKSKMENNGCTPDALIFKTIIRALVLKEENDKAAKLLQEMIARDLLKE